MRRFRRPLLVFLFACAFAVHAMFWWSRSLDDAFITFRYANNIANHGEIVFNHGERVEGITNLGWALFLSLFADGDLLFAAKGTGLLCGVATLLLVARWCRSQQLSLTATAAALGTLAATPWAPYHAMTGLETDVAMLLATAGWVGYSEGARWGAAGMALAPWVRPDTALLAVICSVWQLTREQFSRRVWQGAGIILGSAATLVALKLVCFGAILPTTFHVKVVWPPVGGVRYVARFFSTSPVLGVALFSALTWSVVCVRGAGRRLLPAALLLTWMAAIVLQGGDFMPNWRFFVPAWPAAAATIALSVESLRGRWRSLAAAGVAVGALQAGKTDRIDEANAEHSPNVAMKTSLVPTVPGEFSSPSAFSVAWPLVHVSDNAIAVTELGLASYIFDGPVIDLLGLTDNIMGDRDHSLTPWEHLSQHAGTIILDTESGAWERFSPALARNHWMPVAVCWRVWILQNPALTEPPPDDATVRSRIATTRARAPRSPAMLAALVRELVDSRASEALIEAAALGLDPEFRCGIGLDGCTRTDVACEAGAQRLDVSALRSPETWPNIPADDPTQAIDTPTPQTSPACVIARREARDAWDALAEQSEGANRRLAHQAATGVRTGDAMVAATAAASIPGSESAISASRHAVSVCR